MISLSLLPTASLCLVGTSDVPVPPAVQCDIPENSQENLKLNHVSQTVNAKYPPVHTINYGRPAF